ncbi:tannase/feruloyl esterase family alpha/beta hydrolase [Saccharothrix sp.]|uniref:tannase/feruloyl esterase family alpha/beta hydrolase n=1 Tax=Saccharothrix sp. TaxID=1873460 RepID=UPI0035C8293D
MRRVNIAVPLVAALVATLAQAPPALAEGCGPLRVPGAAHQELTHLDDLSTAGGRTDPADWAGLTPAGLPAPTPVAGTQVDGYFPDDSTSNTNHGWAHDSQFVIRLPENWNGGLVVAGSPGVREQYANDRAISDFVLARGYAFASTDKGNTGAAFHRDGDRPGDAIVEWNRRVTQLTVAAKAVVAQRYCRPPSRTLATGLSNGGYLVRWQLENFPWLYDGGVDWEGTLWAKQGPNLLTFLPPALKAYPQGDKASVIAAGFPAESEFLWDFHHRVYWDLTQRIYREELDPAWDGDTEAGTPFCAPGTPACDADYDYASRPQAQRAVARIALTGRIGKPLLTLHGTLDTLLPISKDSDVYAQMIKDAGRGHLFRYYRIEGGTHVDALYDAYPDRLRPLTPCHRTAFAALEGWLRGTPPPASATVARPPVVSTTDCALT